MAILPPMSEQVEPVWEVSKHSFQVSPVFDFAGGDLSTWTVFVAV